MAMLQLAFNKEIFFTFLFLIYFGIFVHGGLLQYIPVSHMGRVLVNSLVLIKLKIKAITW